MPEKPQPIETPESAAQSAAEAAGQELGSAVVNLSSQTWGRMGAALATVIVAAAGWGLSMKADVQRAIDKIDSLSDRISQMERRTEKLEDRLFYAGRPKPKTDNGDGT